MSAVRHRAVRASSLHEEDQRRAILTRTVEFDVIPRLLEAHAAPVMEAMSDWVAVAMAPLVAEPFILTAGHVADLVSIVLADGDLATIGFVESLHESGAKPETIFLDLLAPAARKLGEMWDDDECDFTEVTVGLWRLQTAMRELKPAFQPVSSVSMDGPRILLVPMPGETHSFGLSMVYEFFYRAGWNAWTGPVATSAELCDLVRSEWVEVIGVSIACDEMLDAARRQIAAIRRTSRNPKIGVLVGGPGFIANPALAASIGADGTATDGRQAVLRAQALMDMATLR